MYRLIFKQPAQKAYHRLLRCDRKLFSQVHNRIIKLQKEPFLGKPLMGTLKGCYSLRVRDYRIVYEIKKKRLIICVLAIAHRQFDYKI